MSNSTIFNYSPGSSLIHRLDPRVKILLTVVYVFVVIFINNPLYLGIALVSTLSLWLISDLSLGGYKSLIKAFLLSIIFMLILNGFFIPGSVSIFELKLPLFGLITYTLNGLISSISLGFRLFTLFFMTPIVISTTKPSDLITSLRFLKLPFKLCFLGSIVIRFFPTLQQTLTQVQEAQRSRGLETEKGNLLEKLYKTLPLIFPMVTKCIYIVNNLTWTIESRGFGLSKNPTILNPLVFKKSDYAAIVICLFLIVLIPLTKFYLADFMGFPSYLRL
jgi:energy-coupling factor transport system permease protein